MMGFNKSPSKNTKEQMCKSNKVTWILAMKASPVEGIGHEGEGDQVHSQVVIIQVQGLLGTWNIKAWFQH